MKILIVEDIPNIRRLLQTALERAFPSEELTILVADTAALAILLINENSDINFATVDRNLKEGNGDEVAAELKSREIRFIRYVAFSGDVPSGLGGLAIIEKPSNMEALISAFQLAAER